MDDLGFEYLPIISIPEPLNKQLPVEKPIVACRVYDWQTEGSDDQFTQVLEEAREVKPLHRLEYEPLDSLKILTEQTTEDTESRLKRFAKFVLFRSTAWTEWAAGIAAGNIIAGTGISRVTATTIVMAGVYKAESIQVRNARAKEPTSPESPDEHTKDSQVEGTLDRIKFATRKAVKAIPREAGALASAMWQGAPATMNHNRAFGIENTPARGKAQSFAYAVAVGAWVSPLPFAETARKGARSATVETLKYAIDNPLQSGLGTLAISGSLFLLYEKLEKRRSEHSQ